LPAGTATALPPKVIAEAAEDLRKSLNKRLGHASQAAE
jgi:hypothetical protein